MSRGGGSRVGGWEMVGSRGVVVGGRGGGVKGLGDVV